MLKVALKNSEAHVSVAQVLVSEGNINVDLRNNDGKAAWEIAINSEIKATCEPQVESTSFSPSYL